MNRISQAISLLLPLFGVLLPLLVIFDANPGEVWLPDFFIVLIFLVGLSLAVLAFFYLIAKNLLQASCATFVFFLPFSIVNEGWPFYPKIVVWVVAAVLAVVLARIKSRQEIFFLMQRSLVFPLLILMIYYGWGVYSMKNELTEVSQHVQKSMDKQVAYLRQTQDRSHLCDRDIYFIILDEFVSQIAFEEYYKYDNSHFFKSLSALGFRIVPNSYANYPWTIPSVSSMIAMDYHANWVQKKAFPQVAHTLVCHNLPRRLLEQEGYTSYHVPSVYWLGNPPTGLWNDFVSRAKSYGLVLSLLNATPFSQEARGFQRKQHRAHIIKQLAELQEIAGNGIEKKFVFAHLLCPHRPIVFDRDGQELAESDVALAEKDSSHHFYLNQAYFISQAIENVVRAILSNAKSQPIIILLSDHGKFPIGVSGKGKQTLPLEELSWRFSNFMALYLPDYKESLPPLFTPVNGMRLVLREYFGYDLGQLDDMCCPDFYDLEKKIPANSLDLSSIFQDSSAKLSN